MKQITVYSKPNCSQCESMKRMIKASSNEFTEINVMEDEHAYNFVTETIKAQTMPVVIIDDNEPIVGNDLAKLMEQLGV